jgi:hypothetical protein
VKIAKKTNEKNLTQFACSNAVPVYVRLGGATEATQLPFWKGPTVQPGVFNRSALPDGLAPSSSADTTYSVKTNPRHKGRIFTCVKFLGRDSRLWRETADNNPQRYSHISDLISEMHAMTSQKSIPCSGYVSVSLYRSTDQPKMVEN